MNVILIGYRATGKTSVGRRLAELLGFPFHDTDEAVSKKTGSTVRQLVATGGWDLFRREERAVVAAFAEKDGCVLSLGGGAAVDQENTKRLRERGFLVWLKADAETIARRLKGDEKSAEQRPPLADQDSRIEVSRMLREREEVYRKAAHVSVETKGKTIEEVTGEIVRDLEKGNPSRPPLKLRGGENVQ